MVMPFESVSMELESVAEMCNLEAAVERVLFNAETQRRKDAEKRVFLCFFESYFHFCNTIQATPNW